MLKKNLAFGLAPFAIVLALLAAVALSPEAGAVVSAPAGFDLSAMISDIPTLVSEAWAAF